MSSEPRNPYKYEPTLAAAVIFAVCFGLSTVAHAYQLVRGRTWYFIPFLVGGLCETAGYVVRSASAAQGPNYGKDPYIAQTFFILIAPAFYAASIYMVLGRIMILLEAESYSLIRRKWLTRFYVGGDVLSLLLQAAGGGLIASASEKNMMDIGENILLVGLFVQIVFFGLFMAGTALFHYRIIQRPTERSSSILVPWLRYVYVLYGVGALVMVRSIFRVIEYIQGDDGELQSNEVYFYVLDTALMLGVTLIFNIFHPQTIISRQSKGDIPLMSRDGGDQP